MTQYKTVFGSLDAYATGGVEVIDDDPKFYAFSNVFAVASDAAPYEQVAVGKTSSTSWRWSEQRASARGGPPPTTSSPW